MILPGEAGALLRRWIALACAVCLHAAACAYAVEDAELVRCRKMDEAQRLKCYDDLASRIEDKANESVARAAVPDPAANNAKGKEKPDQSLVESSPLALQWDLQQQEAHTLLPHKQNYVAVRYSNSPNQQPVSANFGAAPPQDFDRAELKYQFSLKVKAWEHMFDSRADLWLGYTQQSNWQVFNGATSRPFRESDYEPEIIVAVPIHPDRPWLGLQPRLVNFGLVHQSNGQSDPLSRSWNRAYVQLGLERKFKDTSEPGTDGVTVLLRPWYRFPENSGDDNPDIAHYLGYGDVTGILKLGPHTFSMLLRNNLQTQNNRGSVQLDWSVPFSVLLCPFFPHMRNPAPLQGRDLKFYVQFFTGYGESLIDYNHYQTTIGVGVLLADWM